MNVPLSNLAIRFTRRGGTNICPVFEPKSYQQFRTDGYGPYSQTEPNLKTLWIITVDAPSAAPGENKR